MRPIAGFVALPLLSLAAPSAAHAAAAACAPADLAALSGWSGVWVAEGKETGINGRDAPGASPDWGLAGLSAPWTDEAWGRMAAVLRLGAQGQTKQKGWGFPMMMDSFSELKFVIAPSETVIVSQYRDIRYVYTDGRDHPPEEELWPTNWGDSIGCWEGDTLRIETVGVRFDPTFNFWAPPLSENARYTERLRLVAPDRIEGEITVIDPATLTEPWTHRWAYVRAGALDRLVHDGETSGSDRTIYGGEVQTIAPPQEVVFEPLALPPEVRLSDAELDRLVGRYSFDGAPVELVLRKNNGRLQFMVPPSLTFFLPLFASGPLSFASPDGGSFNFLLDGQGAITGFEGFAPNLMPVSGKRIAGSDAP